MPSHSLQILVVEDHAATNETLVRMLRRSGHEVSGAKSAEAALDMVKQQRFDLMISDIGLPDGNGWDLLKKLRSEQPAMRAIALSGYGYPNDMKRSSQVGFERHLTKPVDWPTIKATLTSLFPELAEAASDASGADGKPGAG